jgi:hypothetical protein
VLAQANSKDEIEINIDRIEPRTFYYLAEVIKKKIPEKEKKSHKKKVPAPGEAKK